MALLFGAIAIAAAVCAIGLQADLMIPPRGESWRRLLVPLAVALISGIGFAAFVLSPELGPFFRANESSIPASPTNVAGSGDILASRIFAGPTQYPPANFAAYGIVAFPERATANGKARHEMICTAYVAVLNHVTDIEAPFDEQMVTVWPIETDSYATKINRMARDDSMCPQAVKHYGLKVSNNVIDAVRRENHKDLDGQGPFLMAWSPSQLIGQPEVPVLMFDLSNVTNEGQAIEIFRKWRQDIQEDPEIWKNGEGWSIEKVRRAIRDWSDRFGPDLLKIVGVKD